MAALQQADGVRSYRRGSTWNIRYSCGVRSSWVIAVIRLINHSESFRSIDNRYDRYRNDGMFLLTGLVDTELV